jgi:hypothetical protein
MNKNAIPYICTFELMFSPCSKSKPIADFELNDDDFEKEGEAELELAKHLKNHINLEEHCQVS